MSVETGPRLVAFRSRAAAALGATAARWRARVARPDPLATQLLLLTAAFTAVVAVLILAPSAATFHERWLRDRLQSAELASVGVEALPYSAVEPETADQLLAIGGVTAVAVSDQGVLRLLLQAPDLPRTPDFIDLRADNPGARLLDPWRTLTGHPERSIRVRAAPRYRAGDYIEIVAPAEPLRQELRAYLLNTLLLSLAIAVSAGGLLYAGLALLVLRPLRRVTRAIERFAEDPQGPTEPPSARDDAIGQVERELARMQAEVRQSLQSRQRLVALGEAVARINHDLRNMLTSAQMASDRLAASADPQVARALPRLERALTRASDLSRNVLDYGRSEEPPPVLRRVSLAAAVAAAAEDADLDAEGVRLERGFPARTAVQADPDQLHRILVNLMRNARQAILNDPGRDGRGRVRVSARRTDTAWVLRVEDDGPGVPPRVRERLFLPFVTGAQGGTGLGLAIARELARAHGGELDLVESGPDGTVFELVLPLA
jgi:signal transduction histidine kinase